MIRRPDGRIVHDPSCPKRFNLPDAVCSEACGADAAKLKDPVYREKRKEREWEKSLNHLQSMLDAKLAYEWMEWDHD